MKTLAKQILLTASIVLVFLMAFQSSAIAFSSPKQNADSLSQKISSQNTVVDRSALFAEVTATHGLTYNHIENEFVDFKIQPLLPHMHSRLGPGLATADINNDGFQRRLRDLNLFYKCIPIKSKIVLKCLQMWTFHTLEYSVVKIL